MKTQVHLVHQRVDLGSHVQSAWWNKETALREADRLQTEYIALYGKLSMEPNFFVVSMDVADDPTSRGIAS